MNTEKKKTPLLKKIIKYTGISLLVIIVLLILAPFIFKDKIVAIVKEQANNNLNAKVDFGEFDLSIFSSFPDFRFKINNVSVVGVDTFAGDTLAFIKQLSTDINLKSVISGGPYGINAIVIDQPRILGKVLKDGKANWDIAKADTTSAPTETAVSEPTKFNVKLKSFKIIDANIIYDDQQGNMYGKLEKMNYDLKGDFTQDNFILNNVLDIAKTTFKMSGVAYLNEVHTSFKADLDMDMPKMKFTFKENELGLNDLGIGFNGFVEMPDTNIKMDLSFKAKQAEFKSILSLIPAVYSKDFASVKTAGKLSLDGMAKGTYNAVQLPAFTVNLGITDAMFKYPSLPKSVNNINIAIHVNNPNGVLDATTIDVDKFHIEMAGNPIDLAAHVKTPISDPGLRADVKGTIVLASVKEFVPMEKTDDLTGIIKSDISIAGHMSAIEKQDYEKFKANGSLQIDQMNYKTASLPYEVALKTMLLKFSNQFVELANFDANLGKSDIKANGKIENFMQYIFKNELIKGRFALNSQLLDLNELMASTGSTTTTAASTPSAAPTATATSGAVEVPSNIDFVLDTKLDKVLYTNMDISNLVGNVVIRNSKVDMTNLKMNTLGGSLLINGFYETSNIKKPTTGLNLKVDNFDIQKTFATFNTVQKLAPAAQYAKGLFSCTLENFNTSLNDKMEPDLNAVNAKGVLKTSKVSVGGFPPFMKLGEALKIEQLKNLDVSNLLVNYTIQNGRVVMAPFDTKLNNIPTNISGSTGFDQTIEYKWKMEVPKSMFGGAANSALTGLLAQANSAAGTSLTVGDKVKVNVLFGGTVTNPTVKTSLKEDAVNAVATVTTQALNTAIDKANEQAQKYLEEAKAQCEKQKAEAQAQAEKQKAEGYAAADALVEQAGNPIAKIAAKKAAEKAKQEVDKKVQKIIDDAEAKCLKSLEEAKAKADAKATETKR